MTSGKLVSDLRQKHCPTNMDSGSQRPPGPPGLPGARAEKNRKERRQGHHGTARGKFKAKHYRTYAGPSVTFGLRGERGDQGLNGSKEDNGIMVPPGSK